MATVLVVVAAVVLAGWLWAQKSDRTEVLALRHDVPAGAVLRVADFKSVTVAGVSSAVPVSQVDSVAGKTTSVGLVAGQLLSQAAVTSTPVPALGQRMVGLRLDASRVPAGLTPGSIVEILEGPPAGDPGTPETLGAPQVLAPQATVHRVSVGQDGQTRLAVLVADSSANQVAGYGAAGRVVVVQAPLGSAGTADPSSPMPSPGGSSGGSSGGGKKR